MPYGTNYPDPDGADLLDELHAALTRYVVLPTREAADAVTLWIAATYGQPAWQHAPRLGVQSPEKRCGKSRLLDVVEATCHAPLITVNATPSAIFRSIGADDPPTLLIDEADAISGTRKAAEQHEDLRAMVNAGHGRGRPAIRCVGPSQTPTPFATFAMVALAGIGDCLPDTVTDRAVMVKMRRRAPGEQVAQFRHRRDAMPLHDLRDRLAAWVRGQLDGLEKAEPELPLEDRAADTWEPLVIVADAAGGSWPARARTAALALFGEADAADVEASLGVRLLDDVRAVLTENVVASEELVRRLRARPESPWEAFELDQRSLSRRLRAYGVRPDRIYLPDGKQARGYRLEDFTDAFARYLPPPKDDGDGDQTGTPKAPVTTRHTVRCARQPGDGYRPHDGYDRHVRPDRHRADLDR